MNARDTQFAGFAKAIYEELSGELLIHGHPTTLAIDRPFIERIIARRAYDFAYHVMSEITVGMAAENEGSELSRHENMRCIPDLTHWPDEVHDGRS